MKQAVGLHKSRSAREPRALPWAGMNQAFGLKTTAPGYLVNRFFGFKSARETVEIETVQTHTSFQFPPR